MNVAVFASRFPPVEASYQRKVPPVPMAVNVAAFPVQIVAPDAVGAGGVGVTDTDTAVLGPVQPFTIA